MKKCPFCAEEIRDEAVVCKHCGRDLKGGASQVQIVQPKKKTSIAAMGCAVVLGLCGIGYFATLTQRPAPTSVPAPPPTIVAAPRVAPAPRPLTGKGKFQTYSYTFETQGEALLFVFAPPLPADDAVAIEAMRYLLTTEFKVDMRNAKSRIAGNALRFNAASGSYDAIPVRDSKSGKFLGMAIRPVH